MDSFLLLGSHAVMKTLLYERSSPQQYDIARYSRDNFLNTIRTLVGESPRQGPYGSRFASKAHALSAELENMENNLIISDVNSVREYATHGLDFSSSSGDAITYLNRLIDCVAKINSTKFDTSQNCGICGGVGHTYDGCPGLQDNAAVKSAYI